MITFLLNVVQSILNYSLVCWCLNGLLSARRKGLALSASAVVLASVIVSCINLIGVASVNTFISILLLSLLTFVVFAARPFQCLFAGVVFSAINICCELLTMLIAFGFSSFEQFLSANSTVQSLALRLISQGLFFVFGLVTKYILYKKKVLREDPFNPLLLPLPFVSIVITYYIVMVVGLVPSPTLVWLGCGIVLGLFVTNIVAFFSDRDARKKQQYRLALEEMDRQNALNETLLLQQEDYFEKTSAMIHDFKHQLLMLQGMVATENKDTMGDDAATYITQALQALPVQDFFAGVSSSALRCILNQTRLRCEKNDITFDTQIAYSDFSFMSCQDLCAVFSNALDNAFAACLEVRAAALPAVLSLKIVPQNDFVCIYVQNNVLYPPKILHDQTIRTTKGKGHGIGLKNMQYAAKKYSGNVHLACLENQFKASILLCKVPEFVTSA